MMHGQKNSKLKQHALFVFLEFRCLPSVLILHLVPLLLQYILSNSRLHSNVGGNRK